MLRFTVFLVLVLSTVHLLNRFPNNSLDSSFHHVNFWSISLLGKRNRPLSSLLSLIVESSPKLRMLNSDLNINALLKKSIDMSILLDVIADLASYCRIFIKNYNCKLVNYICSKHVGPSLPRDTQVRRIAMGSAAVQGAWIVQ